MHITHNYGQATLYADTDNTDIHVLSIQSSVLTPVSLRNLYMAVEPLVKYGQGQRLTHAVVHSINNILFVVVINIWQEQMTVRLIT